MLILFTLRQSSSFIQSLMRKGKSDSSVNQHINVIKFYYEIVHNMPNRYCDFPRSVKAEKLPEVLSKIDVFAMIDKTFNLKHQCIISLLYSAGLRRSKLLELKIKDIDSSRMSVKVRGGKGKKDRLSILSQRMLKQLRLYYKAYVPKVCLFEGYKGEMYSSTSIAKLVSQAANRVGIRKKVTPPP